jgi:hypothetical protein
VVSVSVVEATLGDLAELRKRAPELADSALAATALVLAAGLDDRAPLSSKALAAKTLTDTMTQLLALAPAKKEGDGLDDLTARRERRLAGRAAS